MWNTAEVSLVTGQFCKHVQTSESDTKNSKVRLLKYFLSVNSYEDNNFIEILLKMCRKSDGVILLK